MNLAVISALILSVASIDNQPSSGTWATVPLGAKVEEREAGKPCVLRELKTHYSEKVLEGDEIAIIENGEPQCVIVLPEKSSGTERSAAKLLQECFQKMAGAVLPIALENQVQVNPSVGGAVEIVHANRNWPAVIWVGATNRTKDSGMKVSDLRSEGFRIRSSGGQIFICGNDESPYRPPRPVNGTFFAAASLLEREFGVRWLWPGDLGEVIPKNKTVHLRAVELQDEPAIGQRIIRNISSGEPSMLALANPFKILGSGKEQYRDVLGKNAQWLACQKTGYSEYQDCTHAFEGWYKTYAKEHPDWFALQPDGTRFQFETRERLCVSNKELVKEVARKVVERYKAAPEIPGGVSITPNDGSGKNFFCMCPKCREMDPPNGRTFNLMFARGRERLATDRFYASYPSLSDRFAFFFNNVAEEVAKIKADAHLVALAYHVYSDAPLNPKKLHSSITIGFVGGNYLSEKAAKDAREQWEKWAMRTPNMFYRPNLLHTGMGLPFVYARQMGDDVKKFYQTGMMAADYDSLIGHWASQGLNYYVLAKLLWDPSLEPEAVIKDYCRSGFGSASNSVYEYFKELEAATTEFARAYDQWEDSKQKVELQREEWTGEGAPPTASYDPFSKALVEVYTPDRIGEFNRMLETARSAASGDEDVLQRIAFLKKGLDHLEARLPVEELLAKGDRGRTPETKPMRAHLADWYASTFQEEPFAVNAVECVRRSYGYLQDVK